MVRWAAGASNISTLVTGQSLWASPWKMMNYCATANWMYVCLAAARDMRAEADAADCAIAGV